MSGEDNRNGYLLQMRDELLDEMDLAEQEFTRLRVLVERMESDIRIGRPEATAYTESKGRLLPRAEGRVLDLYRDLLKLEDKINGRC